MRGTLVVFRKEFAEQFGSKRFIIFFIIICLAGLSAVYSAAQSITSNASSSSEASYVFINLFTTSNNVLPPFISFLSFFAPLVGIILAFDSINRESSQGSLGRLLSQPIFRDSVINGKFLAGLATVSIMVLSIIIIIIGLGMRILGIAPSSAEILRIICYFVFTVVYVGFWMALSLLFSIVFKRIATSALAAIAVWMFFAFFMSMIAGLVADRIVPLNPDMSQVTEEQYVQYENTYSLVNRFSPIQLYDEITIILLNPKVRILGSVMTSQVLDLIPGPLPLTQSLLIVWPHLTSLIAMTAICFGIAYYIFMRQEIRGA